MTLAEIIAANPGISVIDAVQRLQIINATLNASTGMALPSTSAAAASVMSLGNLPAALAGVGGAATKPQRELYVGNLPPGVTVPQLTDFLNAAMKQLGLATSQSTVISAWVSGDGHYAFTEFRTVEETNAALTYLNGLQIGAYQLRVGRPKSFGPNSAMQPALMGLGGMSLLSGATPAGAGGLQVSTLQGLLGVGGAGTMSAGIGGLGGMASLSAMTGASATSNPLLAMSMAVSNPGSDASNVLMLTNLPLVITEYQVKELVSPFGQLKAFNLIKDPTGSSRGSAVFEYTENIATETALRGLDGLGLGDLKLSIQRVPSHMAAWLLQPTSSTTTSTSNSIPSATPGEDEYPASCVIRLGNMAAEDDLTDDELYEELQEDVADECNKHGTVKSVVIPRVPSGSSDPVDGLGYVFVYFTNTDGAGKAKAVIHGRSFNGKSVQATYYPEELFLMKKYVIPDGYDPTKASHIDSTAVEATKEEMD